MKIEKGNQVKVHYTGTLDDGTMFDSSEGREPLAFEVGAGQMIKGFDAAVYGMEVGEVPDDFKAEVGARLAINTQDGQSIPVKVVEVTPTEIVLDANHELAGLALNFKIEIVEIA
jgi:peptidylprolyl isomerase